VTAADVTMTAGVFVAETCVVTLSTVRIIFLARGMKGLASLLGFFEITLWLLAIGQIMQNIGHLGCFLGFALGFSLGNYLGVLIERRLGLGLVAIRVITPFDAGPLIDALRKARYGVTRLAAEGVSGPVSVVLTVVPRGRVARVAAIIRQFDPKAFYSIEPVQTAESGVFPPREPVAAAGLPSAVNGVGRWVADGLQRRTA
jgi:uncharacterized protein YebE (UPF0316 family)